LEQYRSHVSAHLYVVRGFLDAGLCRDVRVAMDRGTAETAEVLADAITEQHDVRRAESIDVDPDVFTSIEQRLDDQLPALEAFFGVPLSGREGAGLLRYRDGGFYRPHRDRGEDAGWPGAALRAITMVVFLNDDGFTGGVLRVGDTEVLPVAGTLVAFPADTLHEVTPVRGTPRDSVVDWCLSPLLVKTPAR
jgi:predicted 2-oxoglutarate/Fe(II)-dependent dioxygenase YbiX